MERTNGNAKAPDLETAARRPVTVVPRQVTVLRGVKLDSVLAQSAICRQMALVVRSKHDQTCQPC